MPTGLIPYSGSWTKFEASHLLRRACFSPDNRTIKSMTDFGLEDAVAHLFRSIELPDPPINFDYPEDPFVPIGESWVDQPYTNVSGLSGARYKSLRAWTFSLMFNNDSVVEKMTLFWHNHFVVSNIGDRRFLYKNNDTLRQSALGDFRQLTKDITIDPAMLRYLNGRDNKVGSPNENFARELLELFTVGKGDLIGPGDYGTFTEQDVEEMAKILTGWRDFGHNNANLETFGSQYTTGRHDKTDKTLSYHFNNTVVSNAEEEEYSQLIDIIFQNDAPSLFIARKLYRWFVHFDINESIEDDIIIPMAQMIRDSDYVIEPALRALLSSEHFYSETVRGCMIKSPIDFVMNLYNQFQVELPDVLFYQYSAWFDVFDEARDMQMTYYELPNVAGWKAYYQEPTFYRFWINSVTLSLRQRLVDRLLGNGITVQGEKFRIEPLKFIHEFENPIDINSMINEAVSIFFAKPISDVQLAGLKEVLIPGLPDFEWSVEYQDYLDNPDDEDIAKSIESKLKQLFFSMLRMPEYQLS